MNTYQYKKITTRRRKIIPINLNQHFLVQHNIYKDKTYTIIYHKMIFKKCSSIQHIMKEH